MKEHEAEIKTATSFKGDYSWFKKEENANKFRELIKVRGWFAAQSNKRFDWEPRRTPDGWTDAIALQTDVKGKDSGSCNQQQYQRSSEFDDSWVDGGWCQLGCGKDAMRLRIFIDLGAAFSFGPAPLCESLKQKAAEGKLGATHVATGMPAVEAEAWDGKRRR